MLLYFMLVEAQFYIRNNQVCLASSVWVAFEQGIWAVDWTLCLFDSYNLILDVLLVNIPTLIK